MTHKCEECGKRFSREDGLRRHIRRVHEGKKYKCKHCDKEFSYHSGLSMHVKSVHEKITFKCDQCSKIFRRETGLTRHIKTIHEGKRYRCKKCNKEYSYLSNLANHFKIVHEGKKFRCQLCSKEYNEKRLLNLHVKRMHEKQSISFLCTLCGKSFSYRGGLNKHLKKHQGIKYKCENCCREFTESSSLADHRKRYCRYHNSWRILRHESLKEFMAEEITNGLIEGYKLIAMEKKIEKTRKQVDIMCKKGNDTIFIDVMATVTKRVLKKVLIEKIKRDYQDHCDLLIIVVFSPNLTKKDLDPYRRKIETKKIRILHYKEIFYRDEPLEMIRQIMWRGDF
ncbi:MAG: C2H2-type zinc finger protein [Promethearchaeota archaeon]